MSAMRVLGVLVLIARCAGMCTTAAWIATSPQGEFLLETRLAGPGDIRRGEQIFTAADCSSCHATPGQTDRLHLGGGLVLGSIDLRYIQASEHIGRPD